MSFAAGFPAIFDDATKKWTEIYIGTKASEVFFSDGQTLEEKIHSGQFNGKDGIDGKDGVTTTITVPGTVFWKEIDDIITEENGGLIFSNSLNNGATFVKFHYKDKLKNVYDCYGYWMKTDETGYGVTASWTPEHGVWQMFGLADGTMTVERVYPIDKTIWLPVGDISLNTGGYDIHQKILNDGFCCFSARIAGRNGYGWWLRNETEGSGFFFDLTNNIYLIWKDNITLKGKLISQGTQSTVIKDFETFSWKEVKISTHDGGKILRENTAQGFNCVKAIVDNVNSFGWWLNYNALYGIGLFLSYSVSDVDIWIGYSFGEDLLHRFSVFGVDTGTIDTASLNSIVSKAKMSIIPQNVTSSNEDKMLSNLLDLNEGANVIQGKFKNKDSMGLWFNTKPQGTKRQGSGLIFSDNSISWVSGNNDKKFIVQQLFSLAETSNDINLTSSTGITNLGYVNVNKSNATTGNTAAVFDILPDGFNPVKFFLVLSDGSVERCNGFWVKTGATGIGLLITNDDTSSSVAKSCWTAVKTGMSLQFTRVWPADSSNASFVTLLKDVGSISEIKGKDINNCLVKNGVHALKINVSGKSYTGMWLKADDSNGFGYFVDSKGEPYTFTKTDEQRKLLIQPIRADTSNLVGFKKKGSILEISGDAAKTINFTDVMSNLAVGEYIDLTAKILYEEKILDCEGSFIKMTDKYGTGILYNSMNKLRFTLSVYNNKGKLSLS